MYKSIIADKYLHIFLSAFVKSTLYITEKC